MGSNTIFMQTVTYLSDMADDNAYIFACNPRNYQVQVIAHHMALTVTVIPFTDNTSSYTYEFRTSDDALLDDGYGWLQQHDRLDDDGVDVGLAKFLDMLNTRWTLLDLKYLNGSLQTGRTSAIRPDTELPSYTEHQLYEQLDHHVRNWATVRNWASTGRWATVRNKYVVNMSWDGKPLITITNKTGDTLTIRLFSHSWHTTNTTVEYWLNSTHTTIFCSFTGDKDRDGIDSGLAGALDLMLDDALEHGF